MPKNKIGAYIFFSSEDDKYRVLGGIGTYIGLMSREIKRLFPATEVYWITRSHNGKNFTEKDPAGVRRFYFTSESDANKRPFFKYVIKPENQDLAGRMIFANKISNKIRQIVGEQKGKNIIIESGEWEGLGYEALGDISYSNVVKVARLHTPLITCMKQNSLPETAGNAFQLMTEYLTLISADCISACTEHVKTKIIRDLLGRDHPLSKKIIVLPNPIDTRNFKPDPCTRSESINLINKHLKTAFLSDKTFNIFAVGSVESRKGVEYVMDAVPLICQAIPNARVCFIGHCGDDNDKNYNANTKLSPKRLYVRIPKRYRKFVKFTDYIDHKILPQILPAGDVFPIMSLGDNFPGTVAELSLAQKPIIALMRGGVKEMLSDHGNRPAAYSLGSSLNGASRRLVRAVIKLHNDPAALKAIGGSLRSLMLKKYDSETVTELIMDSYSKYFK
jgi:glycosyltransferase involved in cell wall biosynthesis